ncbi:MAG TPA: hypothetical protein VEU51_01585 [Candidatus Acidoferrales bacterium]|nr:hypothetical protein [Candidatus Acidoferrales bacterium]
MKIESKRVAKAIAVVLAIIAGAGCGTMTGTGEERELVSSTPISADYDLPTVMYGCWQGSIDGFDSITPISWVGNLVSKAMKTTYTMCYRRRPQGGGVLSLANVEVGGKQATVVSFENHVTAVNVERRTGHLRNHVVFEQVGHLFFVIPISAQQDIYAEEDVVMQSEDLLAMTGQQLVRLNGKDIATMTFHGDFHRVPDDVKS